MTDCDQIDYERHALEAEEAASIAATNEERKSFMKVAELMRQLRAALAVRETSH
jgi:hypothetical protein